jgi:hypothetical protein
VRRPRATETGTEFVISTATTAPKVAALRAHPELAERNRS